MSLSFLLGDEAFLSQDVARFQFGSVPTGLIMAETHIYVSKRLFKFPHRLNKIKGKFKIPILFLYKASPPRITSTKMLTMD